MVTYRKKLYGICGVYLIVHRESGACYVGSSKNVGRRITDHLSCARRGRTSKFYTVLREKGEEAFDFELLAITSIEELVVREKFFIEWYDSASPHNLNSVIDPTRVFSHNMEITEQIRENMSRGQRKRFDSQPVSGLTRQRLSAAHSNVSEETRRKMRESQLKRWRDPDFLAKPRKKNYYKPPADKEAFKALLKEAWKRRRLIPVSAETRAKQSEAHKKRNAARRASQQIFSAAV